MESQRIVLVTGTSMVPDSACSYIRTRGYEVRLVRQDNFTASELHKALDGVSGYLIGGYEEPLAEHFEHASKLEAVAWVGTDYRAYVPGWKRAYELGIAFINSPGTNAISVAEFTVLLILTVSRPFTQRVVHPGQVPSELSGQGSDLYGRRLGIIGLGRIGARVARIAKFGFGMEVQYYAPRRNSILEQSLDVGYLGKDELLSTCDVITLHRPSPGKGEVFELSRTDFETMKESATLINTVHPDLVDLGSLLWAIQNRGIRAAFDGVSSGENWDRLIACGAERFLAIPSMAFNTVDANIRASMRTAAAVCDVLEGGTSDAVNNSDFREHRTAVR